MRFRLSIDTSNSTFEDDQLGPELAIALRALADKLDNGDSLEEGWTRRIVDTNGNTVGQASLESDSRRAPVTRRGRG